MVSALAEEGGPGPRRPAGVEEQMEVPLNLVGRVIGKGGEAIQRLQKESGARIDVNTQSGDPCQVRITGSRDAVLRGRRAIVDVLEKWGGPEVAAAARGGACGGAGGCWGPDA